MRIDYAKLSRPLPPEEWEKLLAKIRSERELREAFPPSRRERERSKQFNDEQWELHMEKMGYGG